MNKKYNNGKMFCCCYSISNLFQLGTEINTIDTTCILKQLNIKQNAALSSTIVSVDIETTDYSILINQA